MKCTNCNNNIRENTKFCTYCGISLQNLSICSNCNSEICKNANFCTYCGISTKNIMNPIYTNNNPKTNYIHGSTIHGNIIQQIISNMSSRQLILLPIILLLGLYLLYQFITNVSLNDAIRIDSRYVAWTCGHFIKYNPDENIDYYNKDVFMENDLKNVNYSAPLIIIDVTSKSNDEDIKLAPYLVIKVISMEPLEELYTVDTNTGCGVGDVPDTFSAILSPKQGTISGAPNSKFEHFLLKSGEKEVFHVYPHHEPGYTYIFKVGVIYTFNGEENITYTDETFTVISPNKVIPIDREFNIFEDVTIQQPWVGLEELRIKNNKKVDNFSSFPLPKN